MEEKIVAPPEQAGLDREVLSLHELLQDALAIGDTQQDRRALTEDVIAAMFVTVG